MKKSEKPGRAQGGAHYLSPRQGTLSGGEVSAASLRMTGAPQGGAINQAPTQDGGQVMPLPKYDAAPTYRWVGATLAVALFIVALTWSFVFLANPPTRTLDQRVQDVASQLKCPICQGESVADSPSLLAQQMRSVIRQQLQSGKSEQEVIQYFEDRYGSQIVWSPPWQGFTLLAWLVPIALLLGGIVLLFFVLRSWRSAAPTKSSSNDPEIADVDDADLERYRMELEQELAADDPIFAQHKTEGN